LPLSSLIVIGLSSLILAIKIIIIVLPYVTIIRKQVLDFIHNTVFTRICLLTEWENPTIKIKSKTNQMLFHEISYGTHKGAIKIALYLKLLSIIQNLIENNQYSTKRYKF
jgi:hypothetical protein